MKHPKSLLTGAGGFVGVHIMRHLISEGHEVYTISHSKFALNRDLLALNILKFQPDYIFHLAAYGNMSTQEYDPEMIEANINIVFRLLNLTKSIPYKAFVNISSSSVALPTTTMYSATKAAGEKICAAFAEKYDKPIVSVRPFSVTGPGEQRAHLIPTLIRSCTDGERMKFVPSPVHDYIAVDDVVSALLLVAENAKKLQGQHVDIGTGIEHTNLEVLNIVQNVTHKSANIELVKAMRSYDTDRWCADTTILKSLGWKQTQTLEEVIRKMYVYSEQRTQEADHSGRL